MYMLCLIALLIVGGAIFILNIQAIWYNQRQQNLIIWTKKDLRPYWILWSSFIFFVALLLLFFFFQDWLVLNNRGLVKNILPLYRQIIDQQRQSELIWNKNAILTPISSWYYELITDDKTLIQPWGIADWRYPIPQPINTAYCKAEDKYRNLWSTNGLDYNWFIYEYLNANKKKDVVVWVLDTGITKKNVKLAAHLVGSGKNVINQTDDTSDALWHGSHIAWVILQTFPRAHILPIKISEDSDDQLNQADIIAGLRYAIDQNVDIISMSFSGIGQDPVTKQLLEEAVNKGILLVAAAWNESQDVTLYYPASYWGVVSVGAIWEKGKSSFSNYGADVQMPWECIYSTSQSGGFVFMDGTSMAAPHLAWVLWAYLSLDKKVSKESEILIFVKDNRNSTDEKSVLNMAKLFNIEKQNNSFYEELSTINSILKETEEKLTKLKANFTDKKLKEIKKYIANNKGILTQKAKNIENIYASLNIKAWFGKDLTKKVNDYLSTVEKLLNHDSVQLISNDNTLWLSLWTSTCVKTSRKCTGEEKKNGCDDTYLSWAVCGFFSVLITGDVKLPANGASLYSTILDYQSALDVSVYQGENEFASGNNYLGSVILMGLPQKKAWEASATVYFDLDKYWFLSVKAVDEANPNNTAIKTQLKPATVSSEKKGKVQDQLNNIGYALDETKEFLSKINKFYKLDPWDYIDELSSSPTNRVDRQTAPSWNISQEEQYSPDLKGVSVSEVVDGDTIKVVLNWQKQSVRLIGVDTPESTTKRFWHTECFGKESSDYLKKLLSHQKVDLEYDLTQWKYDKYDRLLAFVFYNGENINQKLIKDGYGREYTYNKPYKYQQQFQSSQQEAKSRKIWLWNQISCNWERKQVR